MPLFKGFALTFILHNCRKRDYIVIHIEIQYFNSHFHTKMSFLFTFS